MHVLVCDDNRAFADTLSAELRRLAAAAHNAISVTCVYDPAALSAEALAQIDIAFLDIDLGEESGMALARRLRAVRGDMLLIFVTNYIEYSLEGYEVQAFRYLLKSELAPKLPACFAQAVSAFYAPGKRIRLSCDGEETDIELHNLVYAETDNRRLLLHLNAGARRALHTAMTMNEAAALLAPYGFLRIHQSYLVNMAHVKKLQSTGVKLSNELILPVSKQNYQSLKQRYLHWKGRR